MGLFGMNHAEYRRVRSIGIFVFFFCFLVAHNQARASSWTDYYGSRGLVKQIVKSFPPDQYIYIGVGGSPTPILALIEAALGPQAVVHLPLRNTKAARVVSERSRVGRENFLANLSQHLKHFLPRSVLGNKKILLIDYSATGGGLLDALEIVRSFIEERDPRRVVEAAAIPVDDIFVAERLKTHGVASLRTNFLMLNRFANQEFDLFRKYPSFTPSSTESEYVAPRVRTVEDVISFYQVQRSRLFAGFHPAAEAEILERLIQNPTTYAALVESFREKMRWDLPFRLMMARYKKGSTLRGAHLCRQIFSLQ